MPRLSDPPPSRAIPIGFWTHAALHDPAGWSYPLKRDAPDFGPPGFLGTEEDYLALWGDRDHPHTVQLIHFSLEHGEGWTSSAIREADMARWIFGIPGSFCLMPSGDPVTQRRREAEAAEAHAAYAKLAEFDWLGLDFKLWPSAGSPTDRRRRSKRRRELKSELLEVMRRPLQTSVGKEVPHSLLYAAFVARRIEAEGLRACECCHLVFRTRAKAPATVCPDCRRHRPRYRCYPLVDGGWHLHASLGPPAHHFVQSRPRQPRGAFYMAVCSECGSRFESTVASQRLCRNCGNPAGRLRRRRDGSRLGRQRFRFVGEGHEVSVGIRHGDGGQGTISSDENGVIETPDAEIAAQLENNPALRRIE